jgi:hypothetical protein
VPARAAFFIKKDGARMNFNGRWVPMTVMDTIFFCWLIVAVIVVAVLLWLRHSWNLTKDRQKTPAVTVRRKRARRKRR